MESYGELLKRKREQKFITVDDVVRETSIKREYITALEIEDSSVFPGEAYLVGFLRKYAEYLGIPSETVLALYHNKELQESPVPEGLYVKHRPWYVIPLIVLGSLIVIAGIGFIIWFSFLRQQPDNKNNVVVSGPYNPKNYTLGETALSARIYKGDTIKVPASSSDVILTVKDTMSVLALEAPVGVLYVDLAEEREEDIDGDTITDVIVYVSDVSATDASRGAQVRMLVKKTSDTQRISSVDTSEISTVEETTKGHAPSTILEDNRAYPFVLTATFRGSCVFRYRIDNGQSQQYFLTNGETVNISANNRIRLWISNSNAVTLSIVADTRRFDLDVGKAGQVLVEDIRWIRTSTGAYQLVVQELD